MAEDWRQPIPKAEFLVAMRSSDLETAGVAYDIASEDRKRKRIDPPVPDVELESFAMSYLGRCIQQDPEGEWCLSRYDAASEAQRWMLNIWDSERGTGESLANWKDWIEKLYRAGDEKIKRAVVDGILEHLFEEKEMRQLFADWKTDSQLQTAYDEAQLWADTQS